MSKQSQTPKAAPAPSRSMLLDWLAIQRNRITILMILAGMAMVLPLVANNYVLEILTNAWFYVVLCLGLNIVVGYAGLLDLGYAAFFAVGAYTTGILTSEFGVNFWLTIPVAVVASMITGVIIGGPTLRLRSDYLAIVTLGFGEIVRICARNLEITGGASGLIGIERPSLFGLHLNQINHFYYVFLALAILACFISYRLQHSRLGRAWQYVREDEDAAEAMGIGRVAIKLYAYVIGAIFGGVAGCFFAAKMTAISPETFMFQQSVLILVGVVLGGMGKIPGVVIGAFALVLFPEVFRGIGSMRMLVFAVVMLVIILYRPEGIWPARRT
ncbi:branched-chain amino acid ABC transporter permease [Desulfogranum mediterraneum]|uniref:branched-chain amino acid ABC transporter permease n=1 Tax=Desulfogranum mediterraneum TaxID=160661 RepID=UPI001ABFB8B3|nr:branched-chain amino acid ABC transporter permease [Desulfogranum mediterraneum]